MSRIIDFYRGINTDTEGRSLAEILSWTDDELEIVHDYIQWLFPLPEPSQFNPDAPLLTDDDIATFNAEKVLHGNLLQSFERIIRFLGLSMGSNGTIVAGESFSERSQDVWLFPNHNWLRISRILRSLTLLGCDAQARAVYAWLSETYSSRRFPISAETFQYWTDACEDASSKRR